MPLLDVGQCCEQCREPATLHYERCAMGFAVNPEFDPPHFAYYCSQNCRDSHRQDHQHMCNAMHARRTLFRAGDILQGLFYQFRRCMYGKVVMNVRHNDQGHLCLHVDFSIDLSEYGKPISLLDWFGDFSPLAIEELKDEQSALAYMACMDVLLYFPELVEYFVGDIAHTMTEQSFTGANITRDTIVTHSDVQITTMSASESTHDLIEIKLKHNAGSYVIDLSSAQHGIYSPIVPASQYHTKTRIYRGCELGTLKEREKNQLARKVNYTLSDNCDILSFKIVDHFTMRIKEWRNQEGKGALEILNLCDEEFKKGKQDLLDCARRFLEDHIAVLRREQRGEDQQNS